jgi:hypothetical protein
MKAVLDPAKVGVMGPAGPIPTPDAQLPHGKGGGGPVSQHMASNSGKRPNEPGADNHRQEEPK